MIKRQLLDLLSRAVCLFGVSFVQEMHLPRVHEMLGRHMDAAAAARLRMPIDRVFRLSEAVAAHEHVEHGHPFGRVLMVP